MQAENSVLFLGGSLRILKKLVSPSIIYSMGHMTLSAKNFAKKLTFRFSVFDSHNSTRRHPFAKCFS